MKEGILTTDVPSPVKSWPMFAEWVAARTKRKLTMIRSSKASNFLLNLVISLIGCLRGDILRNVERNGPSAAYKNNKLIIRLYTALSVFKPALQKSL